MVLRLRQCGGRQAGAAGRLPPPGGSDAAPYQAGGAQGIAAQASRRPGTGLERQALCPADDLLSFF